MADVVIGGSEHLDEADRVFIGTLVPPLALDPQLIAVVSWVDAESGEGQFKVYAPDETCLSTKLGMLELAKIHLVQVQSALEDDDDA